MATLVDRQGQAVEVPDDQVIQALRSGQYGVPEGQGVPMATTTGEVFSMSVDDALAASAEEGLTFEGAEQRRAREVSEEYGATIGQEVTAGLAGAARGLTFGLSDQALVGMGVKPEDLSGLREANPWASTGAEVAAVAGSLFIPGAQGNALGLLRGAGAAPRAVARLGLGVERGVARAVAPLARGPLGRMAARGIEVGAGSAVEGALYGGGVGISEMAMGDLESTAENLAASVGMGAVIGGGFGAGLGGGFKGLAELAKGTGRLTKRTAQGLTGMWERSTGNQAIPGVSDALLKAGGIVTGTAEEVAGLTGKAGKAARQRVMVTQKARDTGARKLAELRDKIDEGYEVGFGAGTGKEKRELYREISEVGNARAARQSAEATIGEGVPIQRDAMDQVVNFEGGLPAAGLLSEIDEVIKLDEYGFKRFYKEMRGSLLDAKKEISAAAGQADEAGRIAGALDDFKRDVGKINKRMAAKREPNGRQQAAFRKGDEIFERIRKDLEDPGLFGQRMASTQKEVNTRWVNYLEDIKRRPDHRFQQMWETTGYTKKVVADPEGFRKYIEDLGSVADDLDEGWLRKQMKTQQGLIDTIEDTRDLGLAQKTALEEGRTAYREFWRVHDDLKTTVGVQNQVRAIQEATQASGFGAGAGIVGGALVGGPVGAAVGGLAGALLDPARTVRQIATLERMSHAYREKITAAVKGFVSRYKPGRRGTGRIGQRARRIVAPASVGVLGRTSFNGGRRKAKSRADAFAHRVEELRAVTMAPGIGVGQLAKSTETVNAIAPQLAGHIQAKAVKTAQFLLSKAPKDPGIPGPFKAKWSPSPSAIARWERFVAAATDPESVIADLKNGTLTHEAVEALRETSPKIYQQILGDLMENIEEIRESLPYQQRVQLSVLFEVPIDQTTQPSFVAAMQAAQIRGPQPGAGQQRRPPPPGGGKLATEQLTNAQRLAAEG